MAPRRLAELIVGALVAAGSVAACVARPESTDAPTTPAPVVATPVEATPVGRGSPGPIDALSPGPAARPVVTGVPVTATVTAFAFPDGVDARPGPWSPDGADMLAYVVVSPNEGAPEGPVVRLWTVDTAAAAPLWDSGDVQDTIDRAAALGAWRADGLLVLPRADGALVDASGERGPDVEGIAGQPREVTLAPDGTTALLAGPDGAWLLGADNRVRAIEGRPKESFDNWSWRPDSGALALSVTGGDYYVVLTDTLQAEKIAEAPGVDGGGRMPPPRWLVGDRILLSAATWTRGASGPALDHRVVQIDGGRSDSLAALLGLAPNVTMPDDIATWVSPDGGWIVYPQTVPGTGDAEGAVWQYRVQASWLMDLHAGRTRQIGAVVDPVWSPDSRRLAWRDAGALVVLTVDTGALELARPEGGPQHIAWSPDGRWLLYTDTADALWIVSADGLAGPSRLATRSVWPTAPTWAPTGDRFAASVVDDRGTSRLAVFAIAPGG
jgi:hypothetical protein